VKCFSHPLPIVFHYGEQRFFSPFFLLTVLLTFKVIREKLHTLDELLRRVLSKVAREATYAKAFFSQRLHTGANVMIIFAIFANFRPKVVACLHSRNLRKKRKYFRQ
jgi:hypothetical protein